MADTGLDYSTLFAKDIPAPAGRWGGHPKYNFVGGHSDPELQPMELFIESAANVFRGDPRNISMYTYDGGPQGCLPIRRFLVDKLATHRGVHVTTDEVLITSGSGQGINLINNVLVEEGDTVILENFCYAGVLSGLRRLNVNMVGLDVDHDGMRMDQLERALEDLKGKGIRPKYIYTIPTLQNPTGTVMSMDRRREMLRLSESYGVPIFEDECYADLIFEGEWEHAIRSLDDSNRVLHIGSFSKSLAPGIRLGYVVANWDVMSRLLACKGDGGTGAMEQMIVGDYFTNHYEEHMDDLRAGLRRKLGALTAALREHFGPSVEFEEPRGGMFLWVKFPDQVDTRKLVEPAMKEGIVFNPGPDWSAEPEAASNYLRLCFALPSEGEIWEGVEKLAQVFQREGALP